MAKVVTKNAPPKQCSPRDLESGTIYLDDEGDYLIRLEEGAATLYRGALLCEHELDEFRVVQTYETIVIEEVT